MTLSTSLERFLAEMEYPATKDDLLREATRDGLPFGERLLLQELPEQSYSAAWHIRFTLNRQSADTLTPSLVNS